MYRYNASTSTKSHFVDNQNLVVTGGDGDGILADTGNLQQVGSLLQMRDWHHVRSAWVTPSFCVS